MTTSPTPTNPTRMVEVKGGSAKVAVRPWTMAQQDELFPLVAQLVDVYVKRISAGEEGVSLAELMVQCHREVSQIVRRTVAPGLEDARLEWDDLDGEDLYTLAQAVWETSIQRPGGGGQLGKLLTMAGPAIAQLIRQRQAEGPSATSSSSGQGRAAKKRAGRKARTSKGKTSRRSSAAASHS